MNLALTLFEPKTVVKVTIEVTRESDLDDERGEVTLFKTATTMKTVKTKTMTMMTTLS